MQIELFHKRLENLVKLNSDFSFQLGDKISSSDISLLEEQLDLKFPKKLISFYLYLNGLTTENPSFQIIPLSNLKLESNTIHFATFKDTVQIGLDTSSRNQANEWTIVNTETSFEITKSISSFWSNKIWHWLEKENPIWEDNWWE